MRTSSYAVGAEEGGFLDGVRACVPTLLGYLSIGFAAGVVEKTAGMSIMEIALISILLYAGSAQFIAAGMIAAHSPAAGIIATIFIVNLRHFLMSAALSPYFRHLTPAKNTFVGALLTDETFGVAMQEAAKANKISEKWMHGLNITAYLNWIAANIAGAIFGEWIANPEAFGLDFALPAMFIGLLVLQLVSRNKLKADIVVAVSAAAIGVAASLMGAGSVGIILATMIAAAIGMAVEAWK
ncbi:AzlC family ABC transporter permease [Paenibacillus sp.]|uniref:AzlC family ABC transporter permease n=1 Tax=Paenibacillus sp. TaxID=58172 RepID=UPI002D627653|nr:AzlC family ABC transporter permease [Paenibacillus sp.]HZG85923.1 AzlC family ABC transporter permease [Paenibacillus sp.]